MHDTAFQIGTLAMNTYANLETASVLEIGAQNVNGSLRSSALPTTNYIGIDMEAGEGVDFVALPGEEWPVEDDCFDLVMATSVFEHDTAFWKTFLQMCRKAKAGGYVYISAPSNGKVHRYPQDYWRFYPDAGLALEALAKSEGIALTLVESFIAERAADEWNDFCAIFRRGPSEVPLPTDFIWQRVACTNALTWQSPGVFNSRENTEDQILFQRQKDNFQYLQRQKEREQDAWAAERDSLARSAAEARLEFEKSKLLMEEVRGEIDDAIKARELAENRVAALDHDLQQRDHRISELESHLRQRQEETTQAWSQVVAEQQVKDELTRQIERQTAEVEQLMLKVREADEWVYKLSGERREAEQRNSETQSHISELLKERERLASELNVVRQRLSVERDALNLARAEKAAVKEQLKERIEEIAALNEKVLRKERLITHLRDSLSERESDLAAIVEQSDSERKSAEDRLNERFCEIATLTNLLANKEAMERQAREQLEWLQSAGLILVNGSPSLKGRLLSLMPAILLARRQRRLLKRRGLFDGEAYLAANADVAADGADPLGHYLKHGMSENRRRG